MAQAPNLPPCFDRLLQAQMRLLAHGGIPTWFHGAISRADAEDLLAAKPLGSFLLRVSHSHVGYTLSYKAQSGCRHFIVKLLDTGGFLIPGQKTVHASLASLVAFHQQQPLWPYQELLTQACGQKDPENVDYEDLLLYSNALTQKDSSPPPVPSPRLQAPSCPSAAPKKVCPRPAPRPRLEDRMQWTETAEGPLEGGAEGAPRALLEDTCHRLWRNLKTLPRAGKKVQQQLKRHLPRGPADAPPQSQNVYVDLRVAPAARDAASSTVCSAGPRACNVDHRDSAAPQRAWVPEEYGRPPPFAPGFS